MVPPYSHRVSRVRRYSGFSWLLSVFAYETLTLFGGPSHVLLLTFSIPSAVRTPKVLLLSVWPLPRSLATTCGISVDVFSSPYLDVSVQAVPFLHLFDSMQDDWILSSRVAPFGDLRVKGYLLLTAAYRSLSRPSSAPDAKAFPLCSSSLELLCTSSDILCVLVCLNCCVSRFTVTFFASKIVFFVYPILRKDLLFSLSFLYTCSCTFSLYSVFNEHLCESLRFACSP